MRPPVDDIVAPVFPPKLPWVNVPMLRMDQLLGDPVLVEFWDFCRVNSLRTLPYVTAWHRKYREAGLRLIGVHAAGFEPSQQPGAVRAACTRLGVEHPVVVDERFEIWNLYGNRGWPARYLWTGEQVLRDFHYGEGGYAETEREIQKLLGVEAELVEPVRPEDEPGAVLHAQTADHLGAYAGPYEAGGVWAVVSGEGVLRVNGREVPVAFPGCIPLIEHERHTVGELAIEVGEGVTCWATCFTPGLA